MYKNAKDNISDDMCIMSILNQKILVHCVTNCKYLDNLCKVASLDTFYMRLYCYNIIKMLAILHSNGQKCIQNIKMSV